MRYKKSNSYHDGHEQICSRQLKCRKGHMCSSPHNKGEHIMKTQNLFKTWIVAVLAISLVAVITVSAFAQGNTPPDNRQPGGNRPGGKRPGGSLIQRLDTDGDGKVSKDEFLAEFTRLDQNQDGYIEESEMPQPPGPPQGGPQGQRPQNPNNG
jgi:hypothetical protein